jgi:phosphate-selective porin OprO/OprP
MKRVVAWAAVFLGLGFAAPTFGDPASSEEMAAEIAALKATIQDQESRLAALESRLQEMQKTEADPPEQAQKAEAKPAGEVQKTEPNPSDFHAYWKDGLRLETQDGNYKLKFGGRLQIDGGWIGGDELQEELGADMKDGVEMRRARLSVEGTMYQFLDFKLEYDFATGAAVARDVFLRFTHLPGVGNVTVGHFKEPFGLEEFGSDNYSTFIERGLPDAFAPGFNLGIMANNTLLNERMTWAVGAFRDTDESAKLSSDDGGYGATARVTALPWYAEDGKKLLHLGAAYSLRTPTDDTAQYSARPEAHFVNVLFTDTGKIPGVSDADLFGTEAALVCGPLSFQSEYVGSALDRHNDDCLYFDGAYGQVSYFLTGEHRPYRTSNGTFDNVRPNKNFRQDGGVGAWELAVRYSFLDLRDGDLPATARLVQDLTAGLNWYLTPNIRLMWNYIHSWVSDDADGSADIALTRVQVVW